MPACLQPIAKSLSVSDPESGSGTLYEEMLELNVSCTLPHYRLCAIPYLHPMFCQQNGCICCTVKDNGVAAIEALMDRRRRAQQAASQASAASSSETPSSGKSSKAGNSTSRVFDHILLETTGLADPGPIAQMFWQDEGLASGTLSVSSMWYSPIHRYADADLLST